MLLRRRPARAPGGLEWPRPQGAGHRGGAASSEGPSAPRPHGNAASPASMTPTSADYDLRRLDDVARLFDAVRPDLVIHLAARVGGIGANMAPPGRPLPRQPAHGHLRHRAGPPPGDPQDRGHGNDLLVPEAHARPVPARLAVARAIPRRPTPPTASPSWRTSSRPRPTASSTARTRLLDARPTSTGPATSSIRP